MKSRDFIEHSIIGALSFFRDSVFSQEIALRRGFLQSLDPRVKSATILILILLAVSASDIRVLFLLYVFCLALAVISKIGLLFFLMRTWIFIPLFSLFIALPAIFSFSTPGEVLITWQILSLKLSVTRPGLNSAMLFVAHVITSVSFAVLLSITTKHFELLKVLRIFKVPRLFVMTLGTCYRYIYFFAGLIQDTYVAIKSRVGRLRQPQWARAIVASSIASLWGRSVYLNEEAYKAMLSRGYKGEALSLDDFIVKAKDWIWLFLVVLLLIMINLVLRS